MSEENSTADEAIESRALAHAKLKPWMQTFVTKLETAPWVNIAAEAANVSTVTAYKWREKDLDFREAWDVAVEKAWDNAEHDVYKRAFEGEEKTFVTKTGEVRTTFVKSERLAELMLKGNRAKTYRETHGPAITVNFQPASDAVASALTNGSLDRFIGSKLAAKQGVIVEAEVIKDETR